MIFCCEKNQKNSLALSALKKKANKKKNITDGYLGSQKYIIFQKLLFFAYFNPSFVYLVILPYFTLGKVLLDIDD